MKLLHVIPSVSLVHGGPTHALMAMEAALTDAGVDVTTLTTDDDGPGRHLTLSKRPAVANGAQRVYLRKRLDAYKIAPGAVLWLWRNARRFDVAHIHAVFSFTSTAAAIICRLRGVPYVVRPLGTLASYGLAKRRPWLKQLSLRVIELPALAHAGAVHFTSRDEMEDASRLGCKYRSAIVPLCVDLPSNTAGQRVARQADPDAAPSGPRIVYLGRLDPKKNIECLLDAFAQVASTMRDAQLVIAGGGHDDYVASLRARPMPAAVADRVEWLGHVDGERKQAVLASATIFVSPSYSENFGIAAVEFMAAGVPCVLSRGIAIAEDAANAGAALAVEPDAAAVAGAIVTLLADTAAREEMSRAGRMHVQLTYSSNVMAAKLLDLYGQVAKPASPERVM